MSDPSTSIPSFQARVIRVVDRIADSVGLFRRALKPAELIQVARSRSGLRDFGDWSFEEPLAVLLKAYGEESDLAVFGRTAVRWGVHPFLSNLLRGGS